MGRSEFFNRSLKRSVKRICLKKDKEAVASVVGTIMALLIFLTFMSIFVTTYIPIWMKDNERGHMNQVQNQFGDLKGKVDNLIAYTSTIQMYQSIVAGGIVSTQSTKMYQTFDLGSEGVPIFASQTGGLLTFTPKNHTESGMQIMFREKGVTTPTSFPADPNDVIGGKLVFYGPNRYYVEQWISYENGGIIVKQPDGETFRAAPTITLDWNKGAFMNVTVTEIDMIGEAESVYSLGTVGVNVNIEAVDLPTNYFVAKGLVDNQYHLFMNMTTEYGAAYYTYFNSTCAAEGLVQQSHIILDKGNESITYGAASTGDPMVTIIKHRVAENQYIVTVHLYMAYKITYNLATLSVEVVQ
ncbi:MAG: hypothetical protein A4E32_00162 [Methanomassiliicoccales archaeon PtaU1.Bin124]|nr:MAG: hypothetical protein A4E32_00162 [Methanomassiliicoccales archaeon PtaU1.Bin124]